ncbi:SEL1-like repeat protein [Chitinophaga pendula]|uniref:SEL1-like repeat protein n=1 Tax=Chitinophaga TaxID=79328 RepID=UPI000BAEC58E|nr:MULTISPECIES: SEL1-like repeat protein [Chitinophaga]ASZ10725.1 hypothetical protein CK934_06900 [Chitinophaga sp. MD30]UCJ06299.1 SEL1-like repeat protein [Chitinophaga pendula]
MAHRMYLYNLDTVGTHDDSVVSMMEWNYEFPLLLQPLFAGHCFTGTPILNGEEGGLYAEAKTGISYLLAFYDLLERHAGELINDLAAFQQARHRIFRFLSQKARGAYFHLDAWDVFNMEATTSHEEQATALLGEIKANTDIMISAIAADDPVLLDNMPGLQQSGVSYSFRELLNHPVYAYGWEVLTSGGPGVGDVEVFETGGRYGLKDVDGNVLLAPMYLQLFGFGDHHEHSVVEDEQHRYGFIDKLGRVVVPCVYEDAYDFEGMYAAVKKDGKWGLINTKGGATTAWVYEDLLPLPTGGHYWEAVREGKRGVIDMNGEEVLPFLYEEIVPNEDHSPSYYTVTLSDGNKQYLTTSWQRIQFDAIHEVEGVSTIVPDGSMGLAYVVQQVVSGIPRYGLADESGVVLLPASYDHIGYDHHLQAFILQLHQQQGLYTPGRGLILDIVYQHIEAVMMNWHEEGDAFGFVLQGECCGIVRTMPVLRWVLPLAYEQLQWLKERCFGFRERGKWGVADVRGTVITAPQFDKLNNKMGSVQWGLAIAFSGEAIYVIAKDGRVRMLSGEEAQAELEYDADSFYTQAEIVLLQAIAEQGERAAAIFLKAGAADDAGEYTAAISLYEEAAALGHAGAMVNLGYMYRWVPEMEDVGLALAWNRQAAEHGHVMGYQQLGDAYLNGWGMAVDFDQARYWYEQAAERHYGPAFRELGHLYYEGHVEGVADYDKAMEYYRMAHYLGEQVAVELGWIYGVIKQDAEESFRFYTIAAERGESFAQWRLGVAYMSGLGCEQDIVQARAHLEEAAQTGTVQAYLDLVTLYMEYTTPADTVRARQQLEAAIAAGAAGVEERAAMYGL